MGPTTHYHATTVFIEQIITASQLQQSLDTLNGRTQPVATERALPLTPVQFSTPLVIGNSKVIVQILANIQSPGL